MKNNGNRYCKVCGSKLQKRGKHRNGSQRWLCIKCKKSFTLDRPDVVNKAIKHKFNNWILNQAAKTEKGIRNFTFWRRSKYLLHRSVEPVTTGEQYEVIIIDGKWIEDEICLITRTPKYGSIEYGFNTKIKKRGLNYCMIFTLPNMLFVMD